MKTFPFDSFGNGIGERNYCYKCGRSYKKKAALTEHLKWECGKDPSFGCPFCRHRSKRKSNMRKHIRFVHRNETNAGFVY